jgi:TRAP-type uncharacterized transport system substrate-binding protein
MRTTKRNLGRAIGALVALSALVGTAGMADARSARRSAQDPADRINAGVVTVISGTVSGTFLQVANDLSYTLDDGDTLRVLPIVGKGAEQNLRDVLMLRGVDVGIVRSDGLEAIRNDPKVADRIKSLAYVTKLFTDEGHLIAGPGITDIRQLAGKKVNFDLVGSGANFTGRRIFDKLGIQVEVTNVDQMTSYEMLRRGEIAATFQMSAKPISAVARIPADYGFHLVAIPFDDRISDLYLPGELTSADYPNLVKGGPVGTVTVSSILAVYNWPEGSERYRKVARFVDALFTKFPEFQKPPRHPKWAEVNLAATVPGWTRFKAAQDWLDREAAETPSRKR